MQEPPRLTSKQLRVIRALSIARRLGDAADVAIMSQPALSRALAGAEKTLGESLFQRGWSGTAPTAMGDIVIGVCRRIYDDMGRVERGILGEDEGRLARRARWRHLRAVSAVTRTGSASAAARALGISQPAVSQALTEINAILSRKLFVRGQAGLSSTADAEALTALWDRIAARLDSIPPMLADAGRELVGRVAVGMLPFSGQSAVLETFAELTRLHPRVQLVAVPGGYNALAEALRRGELDLFFGILRRPSPVDGFVEERLYDEEFTLIARDDHPIHDAPVTVEALAKEQWVVAPHGTPIRSFFDRVFREAGASPPAQSCEIFSFSNAEQMIVHSNSLACLCYGATGLAQMRSGLKRVDVDLPDARVPIGFTRIGDQPMTPAVETFLSILRDKVSQP